LQYVLLFKEFFNFLQQSSSPKTQQISSRDYLIKGISYSYLVLIIFFSLSLDILFFHLNSSICSRSFHYYYINEQFICMKTNTRTPISRYLYILIEIKNKFAFE
jgi:hypothetical protein